MTRVASGQARLQGNSGFGRDGIQNAMIEGRHPVVIEFGGDGAVNGHVIGMFIKCCAISLNLLADIAQGIFTTPFFKLVHHDEIGKIEHIDLFQLGCGPEFTGHHINGHIRLIGDERVALTDTGGFGDNQVKPGRLGHGDRVWEGSGQFGIRTAGGQRTHIDPGVIDGIHADPVPQQGPAGFASGGIAADDGQPKRFLIVQQT